VGDTLIAVLESVLGFTVADLPCPHFGTEQETTFVIRFVTLDTRHKTCVAFGIARRRNGAAG
jgi:hypothetical protein